MSTVTNLDEFTQFTSQALDNRCQVDVVYVDLTKAFKQVNHCILIHKLANLGICDKVVMLVKALLTDRNQYVERDGFRFFAFQVRSSVTQESNLGPILFTIFFNDVLEYQL